MARPARLTVAARWLSNQGMLVVLLALAALLSALTIEDQAPVGADAGRRLGARLVAHAARSRILIVHGDGADEAAFGEALQQTLAEASIPHLGVVSGDPPAVATGLRALVEAGQIPDILAVSAKVQRWPLLVEPWNVDPQLERVEIIAPQSRRWPVFLNGENLLNIANQVVVIATIAIGMTFVILTGGIDLSVGSLVALAAVLCCLLIRALGGEAAGPVVMIGASLVAMAVCGLAGWGTGVMITACRIPPFIVTLAMMMVASGMAYILAHGESIYQLPAAFTWLGRGTVVGRIPNAVGLMLLLYAAAHWLTRKTTLGRHVYAVGGNPEAARLSGVPVNRVLWFAYAASGALAGLGGVITASQLKSGSPTYGLMYELYVIAAVVVGGTSLSGGSGTIAGTLVGACIIAVIQNGMNLLGIDSYVQKVVLGVVMLAAVLLDTLKRRGR